MCKHHYDSRRGRRRSVADEKVRFYRNLRTFIAFNFIVPATWLLTGDINGLWKVSVIWGIIMFFKSVKLFGVPGTDGWLSQDFEDWVAKRKEAEPLADEPEAEPLFDRGSWRERDLV